LRAGWRLSQYPDQHGLALSLAGEFKGGYGGSLAELKRHCDFGGKLQFL
jgi:hypothetical protein